ncbi:hypothetical protein [Telmatospirillum siberiense]|uniref:Uncharacterized protein n=1 Tax=Telmatospirillum siberiense TaxID=382514 RepID=A0A2N3PPL7_9PROT|nr:hypothetical protein [Telmatospirillum siberiense]PKU22336.1 hypothetical protein CWS72_21900 [Telmatospirillum siberiense]
MTKSTKISLMASRLFGLLALGLGTAYWLGFDVPVVLHMSCGLLVVLALWVLAVQTGRRSLPLALGSGLWGLFIPALGIAQLVLPVYLQMEEAQTVLRGLHVAAGLATIGLAEHLARRLKK